MCGGVFMFVYVCVSVHVYTDESIPVTRTGPFSYCRFILVITVAVTIIAVAIAPYFSASISQSTSSPSLPPPITNFVGRLEDIKKLSNKLLEYTAKSSRIVSITGAPGFGKSTLAIHIGNKLKDKGVNVVYTNLNEVPSIHALAETILISDGLEESTEKNITLRHLYNWGRGLQQKTLLILDNCDEQFHINKNKLQSCITELVQQSKYQKLKVLTTSRQQVMYLPTYKSYILNELPASYACLLLKNIANFTVSSCEAITNLTGNVPLALHVIGALRNTPNPPSPEKMLAELKQNLIGTLSPVDLQTKDGVNASIYLSYQYLDPAMKRIGRLIAYFPGSFDENAARNVLINIDTGKSCHHNLQVLVKRSLLEYNRDSDRYNYHRLIREFFKSRSNPAEFERFYRLFSEHFIPLLERMARKDFVKAINLFIAERHNIQYLFDLLTLLKDRKQGKKVAKVFIKITETINLFMEGHNLDFKFTPMELEEYLKNILSYLKQNRFHLIDTLDKDEFVQIYSRIVMHLVRVKKFLMEDRAALINTMEQHRWLFDKHKTSILPDLYIEFYLTLAKSYEETGDFKRAVKCHQKRVEQLKECEQNECNYVEIGDVYFQMNDYNKSIMFYEMELNSSSENDLISAAILMKLYDIYMIQEDDQEVDQIILRLGNCINIMVTAFNYHPFGLIQQGEIVLRIIELLNFKGRPMESYQLEQTLIASIRSNIIDIEMSIILMSSAYNNKNPKVVQVIGKKIERIEKNCSFYSFLLGMAYYHTEEYNKSYGHLSIYVTCDYWTLQESGYHYIDACIYLIMMGSGKCLPLIPHFVFNILKFFFLLQYSNEQQQSLVQSNKFPLETTYEDFLSTDLASKTTTALSIVHHNNTTFHEDSQRNYNIIKKIVRSHLFYYLFNIAIIYFKICVICQCLRISCKFRHFLCKILLISVLVIICINTYYFVVNLFIL